MTLTAAELLTCTDTFIFDCDGVLYNPSGLIAGAPEALQALRAAGKRVFFLTNSSSKTRAQIAESLLSKGIAAEVAEIYGSAYLAARYLKRECVEGKVYVCAGAGVLAELEGAGFECAGGPADNARAGQVSIPQMSAEPVDASIKAVVVGAAPLNFSYFSVSMAVRCLVENAGCQYLLTNPDLRFPLDPIVATPADPAREGQSTAYLPGAGAMAAAISSCVGREPVVCGKPESLAIELICAEHGIERARTCMVGDTLMTDIEFGHNAGLKKVLVLTGNTNADKAAAATGKQECDCVLESVAELNLG